ncbi:MAG: hypothetical protein ORN28_10145 [Rhodoferax sp.]|nr:hypothetical protein [Rhodoferax sp.]
MACRYLQWCFVSFAVAVLLTLAGCDKNLNNPHPSGTESSNTLLPPFLGSSPKYLDPASSYSSNETPFTYQVYEPLYGYHYLKRLYELIDCGKPTPFVDRMVFDMEKEAVPLKANFLQGYYDAPPIERLDGGTALIVEMGDSQHKAREYGDKGLRLPSTIEPKNGS